MLIEVKELTKIFELRRGRSVTAAESVSFDIERGQTVGLVGESGSGKSTVGRCVLRLLEPDEGVIRFDGEPLEGLSQSGLRPFRPRMQMVFQDPLGSLNPAYTVKRTLCDAVRQTGVRGDKRREQISELLDSVGLDHRFLERRPHEMSGGQLQRVGIARALASDPEFIFLDEPTSSLDLSIRGQILNLLADLQAERRLAYLFASHDLGVVRFLAHRVIVMYHGRVVESGPAEGVLADPTHPYTRALIAGAGLGTLSGEERRRP